MMLHKGLQNMHWSAAGGPYYGGRCNQFGVNMNLCIVDSDIGSVHPTEPWPATQEKLNQKMKN